MTTSASTGPGQAVLPILARNWWALALRGVATRYRERLARAN